MEVAHSFSNDYPIIVPYEPTNATVKAGLEILGMLEFAIPFFD